MVDPLFETSWSREQVEQMLAADDFEYQDIALPYGLSTGGYDRSATAATIFPDDMSGKTVLDLGSKFGYFCFEALKRGAQRVVGVDVDADSVRKARLLADCLGAKATFEQFDIEKDSIDESFDYVLCLNLLHHMRNPLSLLESLVAIADERLILEVAALGGHDRRKVGVSPIANFFLRRSPIVFVSRNGTWGKRSVQKFFFTPSAVDNLLRFHRNVFARVDTVRSEHKERTITVAYKRRIERLVIVNGPTASGKKTCCRKLVANELPEVAQRVGIVDGADWGPYVHANRLWQPSEPEVDEMILHYDFLRPYLRSAKTNDRDEAMDILHTARHVTFLTIWTPPERLRKQIAEGEILPRTTFGIFWGRKRHRIIAEDYRDDLRILELYRSWFRFTSTHAPNADHVVVCLGDPVELYTVAEWEQMVQQKTEPAGA